MFLSSSRPSASSILFLSDQPPPTPIHLFFMISVGVLNSAFKSKTNSLPTKLGIPTTHALFIAKTGEKVYREKVFPGAIITRVAKSHIRVGTFQYFASIGKYNLAALLLEGKRELAYQNVHQKNNQQIPNTL